MSGGPAVGTTDPLATLREYASLAPWSLRDLAVVAGAILETSGIFPVNAAARARPSERTIRFYVARRLVSPPEGRGTAAIYGYRHLLQVLAIKLRQMEGATLDALVKEFAGLGGDMVERRVAAALGSRLPTPDRLPLSPAPGAPRGKVGRAFQAWHAQDASAQPAPRGPHSQICRRIPLGPGVELVVDDHHPLFGSNGDEAGVVSAIRRILGQLGNGGAD